MSLQVEPVPYRVRVELAGGETVDLTGPEIEGNSTLVGLAVGTAAVVRVPVKDIISTKTLVSNDGGAVTVAAVSVLTIAVVWFLRTFGAAD